MKIRLIEKTRACPAEGHSGDTIDLLDQVLSECELEQDVVRVLEAIKDALERNII